MTKFCRLSLAALLITSAKSFTFQVLHLHQGPLKHSHSCATSRRPHQPSSSTHGMETINTGTALYMAGSMTSEDLKRELTAYLKKRAESNADEAAKNDLGKVVGGTKGNAVLEYISGAPNKEIVIDELPDVFDYSELGKYGYSKLVTPIMDAGGRLAMYELMGMPVPPTKDRIKKVKKVPKLVIDRTGETDQARYTGLKVTQIIDDDEMGRKLQEAMEKRKSGEDKNKQKLAEEEYVMPFADKRNTGPMQTPDWTPERLDEEGRKAGQAIAWAKKAREGEFKTDPFEILSIDGGLQVYSIITSIFVAFAFGNSSRKLIEIFDLNDLSGVLDVAQAPALAIIVASVGSCVLCSIQASGKNRNSFIWGIKGFAGGPLAVWQLEGLEKLITRGESEALKRSSN